MESEMAVSLPELPEPYGAALAEACRQALGAFDARALLIGGTILRGEGHATSDFDLVLIHGASWRQRVQYWAYGVPVELFVNPDRALRAAMQHEVRVGRQVMIHLFRTGVIVLDPEGIAAALRAEAEALFAAGPQLPPPTIEQRQYHVACLLDDACDIREVDADRSRSLLNQALDGAAELHFLRSGRWQPRSKVLYDALAQDDPDAGAELRAVLHSWSGADLTERARTLVEHLAGVRGFFAWASKPEEVST